MTEESLQIMHTTKLLHQSLKSTNHAQKNTATSMTESTNHAHGIAVRYTFGQGFGSPSE
jgi:uncharacterized protein YwbE